MTVSGSTSGIGSITSEALSRRHVAAGHHAGGWLP
jgi:hypothetical protein